LFFFRPRRGVFFFLCFFFVPEGEFASPKGTAKRRKKQRHTKLPFGDFFPEGNKKKEETKVG
jgi:hypothetical protein